MILHIATNSRVRRKLLNQIDGADAQGLLSTPVKYEEVRKHIDYMELITKEALRMSDISCPVLLASNYKANDLQSPSCRGAILPRRSERRDCDEWLLLTWRH